MLLGKKKTVYIITGINVIIALVFVAISYMFSLSVTVLKENEPVPNRTNLIIDPGHGGVDGGATSVTGVLESNLNLEISLRLKDVCNLLGIKTIIIRTDDRSVYTEGETIAQKKISDLKQRVKIANNTENAILISIHQNYFSDERYRGAQVFYGKSENSKELAFNMQKKLVETLNPKSNRKSKPASGIYLMEKIQCPGLLVECGFLSNREEAQNLQDPQYQKKLCCTIAAVLSSYINTLHIT